MYSINILLASEKSSPIYPIIFTVLHTLLLLIRIAPGAVELHQHCATTFLLALASHRHHFNNSFVYTPLPSAPVGCPCNPGW